MNANDGSTSMSDTPYGNPEYRTHSRASRRLYQVLNETDQELLQASSINTADSRRKDCATSVIKRRPCSLWSIGGRH